MFKKKTSAPQPQKEPPSIVKERKYLNRWSMLGLLAVAAIFTALYVSNVVRVKRLLRVIQQEERTRDSLVAVNIGLTGEIKFLESAERINTLATQKLFMVQNPKAPKVLE